MGDSLVVPGWGEISSEIAAKLASHLGLSVASTLYKEFPDSEEYVRIGLEGGYERAIVVQSFQKPASRSLAYTLLIADALKEEGINQLWLVAPYLAYTRQDRVFLKGEPVSIRAVMRAISNAGYTLLATVEPHKNHVMKYFRGARINIFPFTYMFRKAGFDCSDDSMVIVAPDMGSLPRAERLAKESGCTSIGHMVKVRDRITGEISIKTVNVDPREKTAILVDDIVSTGGTIARAAQHLLDRGASRVVVMVAHLLGLPGSVEKMIAAGVDIIVVANTLPRVDSEKSEKVKYIDVTPVVAGAIKGHIERSL